ncbi:MAG: STAS domain-containing protein [Pseudonocardiales bacterium]|nr:STAS domain-containing protein [Pseudonocardiales bacterium]
MINDADPSHWHLNPPTSVPLAHPANLDTTTPVAAKSAGSWASDTPAQLLELSAQHYPAVGICVVVVDGELDMLTAPLLEEHVREQLRATPTHLILDLEPVRFLGCSGLSCLLRARELVAQTRRSQLHLAGLTTHRIARALRISGLLGLFDTYPTLLHAVMAALADHPEVTTPDATLS